MSKPTPVTPVATVAATDEAKRGRGRPPVDPNESPSDRFKRLAIFRVNRAVDDIATIGNLAGNGYEYTPAQVDAIFGALDNIVENTRAKFSATKEAKPNGFTL